MEEQDVESLRRDIGEKMAREGETLHENASDSVKEGYRRGSIGFGSNVMARNFGKGREARQPWTCVCGHENPRYVKKCLMCNVHQAYGEDLDG